MEPAAMFGSILSNAMEVHSTELGIQVALLTLCVRYYTSKYVAGIFVSTFIIVIFTATPITEVVTKPWYFLTGLCTVIIGVERYALILGYIRLVSPSTHNPFSETS